MAPGNVNDSRRESFGEIGGQVGQNVIITRGDTWAPPVATASALPMTGNNLGDIRQALDTGVLWRWNGSAWSAYGNLGVQWKGTYSGATAYVANDIVYSAGSSYICILATTGNAPPNATYWELVAMKGADGVGSGDVNWPASSTDNALARMDGVTGKLIQNGVVTESDTGTLSNIQQENFGSGNDRSQVVFAHPDSSGGGIFSYSGIGGFNSTEFSRNNRYDPTALDWIRFNIAKYAATWLVDESGSAEFWVAAPGANPISNWIQVFDMDNAGNIVAGRYNGILFSGTSTPALSVTGTASVSGVNTGNQTSIVGISGTKAEFNTACSNGDFMYLDSNDTVSGTKAFSVSPTVPTPTGSTDAVNKSYADGLVVGLLDYRGAYNASGNTYPSSGGSGTAGAVLKGDTWVISVAGTLGGVPIQVGDSIIANIDTPGNTAANWNSLNTNVSYVPEDVANKATTMSGNTTSNVFYLTAKAVFDWGAATFLGIAATAADSLKINGISVTGTPAVGNVPIATSGTAATWQAPATPATAIKMCSVYASTTPTSFTANTDQVLAFDNERVDTDNFHSNVTNNSRITVGATGTYRVKASLSFTTSTTSNWVATAQIIKNGSTVIAQMKGDGGGFGAVVTTFPCVMDVIDVASATTDYYEVRYQCTQSSTPVVTAGVTGNSFELMKLA